MRVPQRPLVLEEQDRSLPWRRRAAAESVPRPVARSRSSSPRTHRASRNGIGSSAARHAVLILEPVQQHVELQHDPPPRRSAPARPSTPGRTPAPPLPRRAAGGPCRGACGAADRECTTREKSAGANRGMPMNSTSPFSRERIGHAQVAAIEDPDHVAGPGLLDLGPLLGEELLRLGEPQRLAGAGKHGGHAGLEVSRADPHEGDPVAMPRIHVRLDLEHEAGEVGIGRIDGAPLRLARQRRRRVGQEVLEEWRHPEVGQRDAEVHRREGAGADRRRRPTVRRPRRAVRAPHRSGGDGARRRSRPEFGGIVSRNRWDSTSVAPWSTPRSKSSTSPRRRSATPTKPWPVITGQVTG